MMLCILERHASHETRMPEALQNNSKSFSSTQNVILEQFNSIHGVSVETVILHCSSCDTPEKWLAHFAMMSYSYITCLRRMRQFSAPTLQPPAWTLRRVNFYSQNHLICLNRGIGLLNAPLGPLLLPLRLAIIKTMLLHTSRLLVQVSTNPIRGWRHGVGATSGIADPVARSSIPIPMKGHQAAINAGNRYRSMHVLMLQRTVTLGLPSRSPPIQVLILMTFGGAVFKTHQDTSILRPSPCTPSEPKGRGIVGKRWHPTVLQAAVDTSVMLRNCRPDRILAKLGLGRLPRNTIRSPRSPAFHCVLHLSTRGAKTSLLREPRNSIGVWV